MSPLGTFRGHDVLGQHGGERNLGSPGSHTLFTRNPRWNVLISYEDNIKQVKVTFDDMTRTTTNGCKCV